MEFEILGPLRAVDGDEEVDLGSRKQRTLLALLVVNANRVVTTERIIDELWPGDPDGHENALWVYISRLRGILEPERSGRGGHEVLQTRDHGYVLNVPADSVDAIRFEQLVSEAGRVGREDAAGAADLLRSAEAEWSGRPLEGLDAEFATVEAARLDELRISALEDRFDLDLRQGHVGNLASEIEAAAQVHPYRERLVGQLMLALYRAGRQADALRTFERFRRTIGDDLGIAPSPELVRLEEQILLHDNRLQPRRARAARPSAAPTSAAVDAENPFKGLRAFSEDDVDDFFGRDRLVRDVVRRVADGASLLALVGPSGSGKSSALRAGVIPALRKGAANGSDRWLTAQMVPGARPFAELEAALLRSTLDGPDSLVDQLRGEDGLLGAALRILPDDTSRLLVVIDQFEELFTLVDDEQVRSDFLNALIPGLDDPHGRVCVLLTLRADFYARPLAHAEFGRRMGDGVVNVVPLTTDELEAAAVEPMLRAGCHFEPSLLVALLGDVAGQPGALPVFQYTLTELYERRSGDMLTMASYEQIGGVRGALAQRAEDLFSGLSDDEHDAARQLFLRLVTIGDGDEWGRRRVAAREVLGLDVDVVALQRVIHEFGERRLLSFDRDHVTGSPTVEVAHEALLTEWPRLHDWIADARADVRRRASLGAAAVEWDGADRNPDYLFGGSRLEEYEAWVGTSALALTELERDFLDEAVEKRDAEVRADADRVAREQALDRRARIRAWGLAAAVALIAAVGSWLVFFAGGDEPGPRAARIMSGPDPGSSIGRQLADGWDQAERELDLEFDEPLRPVSDVLGQVRDLVETEPDLVLMDGLSADLGFASPGSDFDRLLGDFPDQLFAVPDEVPYDYPNLVHFGYASHEGSFLAGVAAARTSETGVIGFVGGLPEVVTPFRAGFEAGARYARPDIQVLSTYLVGNAFEVFQVGAGAVEATDDLIDRGADVIYHASGEAGDLVLRAAAERPERHVWVIGVDADQSLTAPEEQRDHVLTSMLKRHDLAVLEILRRLDSEDLEPGVIEGDIENGVLGLVTPGNLTEDVIVAVEDAMQAVIDGTVTVPDTSDRPPIDAVGTDYSVPAEVTDGECAVGEFGPIAGDIVRFDLDNRQREWVWFSIWKIADGIPVESITLEGLLSEEQGESQPRANLGVSAGVMSALTVRFADPGDWLVRCEIVDGVETRVGVTVTEPSPTAEGRVTAEGTDSASMACRAELDDLRVGAAVRFQLDNRTALPVGVVVAKVADGTTELDRNWVSGSGATLLRSISAGPAETVAGVVVLDEPGTYAANCLVFQPPFDDLNAIVFDVAPAATQSREDAPQ